MFSIVNFIRVLLQQPDPQTARKYWNKPKERFISERSQLMTVCHRLKMKRIFLVPIWETSCFPNTTMNR